MSDKRPIGIFDSGVGGLTVVGQVQRILPKEDIVYFGDTARVPYGTKSKETVTKFSVENIEFLMQHNVKLIVVACNTASSFSLPFLKRCFRVPVIGVIEPGARCAVNITRNRRVGVIGTQGTVSSGAYEKSIKRISSKIRCFSKACPIFVPLVEEGWLSGKITSDIASFYLRELKARKIDTLIMGCTHYPLLKNTISVIMGKGVMLVDSAAEVAKEAKGILDAAGLLNEHSGRGVYKFFVSDEPARFAKLARMFLKRDVECVRKAA